MFNQAQVDGYASEPTTHLSETERIAHAEASYTNLGITTVYGAPRLLLSLGGQVHIPEFGAFREAAARYSVLFHEGVHATAAKHRLDVICRAAWFGSLRHGGGRGRGRSMHDPRGS